jgi:hypothetical protein
MESERLARALQLGADGIHSRVQVHSPEGLGSHLGLIESGKRRKPFDTLHLANRSPLYSTDRLRLTSKDEDSYSRRVLIRIHQTALEQKTETPEKQNRWHHQVS